MRRLLRVAGVLLLVLVLLVSVAAVVGVPVPLDALRPQLEGAAKAAIGRPVTLEGPLVLDVGLQPALRIGRLRLANPAGWEGDMLTLGTARLQLGLLNLLRRRIRVVELVAEDAVIALEDRGAGDANWFFARTEVGRDEEGAAHGTQTGPAFALEGLDDLSLQRLEFSLQLPGEEPQVLEVQSFEGSGPPGEPLEGEAQGSLRDQPYTLRLHTHPLNASATADEPWTAKLAFELEGARLGFEGRFGARPAEGEDELRSVDLGLRIEGERLDQLDGLLGVSLPPLGPYRVEGRVVHEPGVLRIPDAGVRVGESELRARFSIERRAGRPRLELAFESPGIQLDDFDPGDWSAFAEPGSSVAESTPAPEAEPDEEGDAEPDEERDAEPVAERRPALLARESLARFDAQISVQVADVRSGVDELGAGRLEARLDEGRLVVDPLHLDLPGGSLDLRAEIVPHADGFQSELDIQVREFDYGVLARRIDPTSEASGRLSLNVQLESRAPTPQAILAHANGRLGFAVFPENLEAAVFDLWAANLLLAMLPSFGEPSELNCAGARMRIENGRMAEEVFVIDTSSMRVGGELDVDFRELTVEGVVAPVSKRPQSFTVATPVRVSGSFDDFGVGVRPSDVALTVVKMGLSPVTAPLTYLIRGTLPREGNEVCASAVEALPEPASTTP